MYVADTLSRASLNEKSADSELNDDMEVVVHSLVTNRPLTVKKLTQMKSETAQDETLQELLKVVKSGWPSHRSKVPSLITHYWHLRGEVHEVEVLLLLDEKLTIPQGMRQDVLNCINESHLGIEKCKLRARAVVY